MTLLGDDTYDVVVGDIHDRGNEAGDTKNIVVAEGRTLAEAEADFEEHARLVPGEHRYVQLRHSGEGGTVVKTYPATG
ncbi:hypothetical protein [Mycobacterium sp. NAZ190054]|uniref:hypothetical protein n=1 Tax=Mycobacterium sp. NAZ190054 TaxID=1747766 RepID=UPI000792E065|nr:hypothetical protein [Mycobacterium sp. NAZ190054]KWX68763.1 hypothetical protein ASJ79_02710 [Mycobacterium sp. NAZ190054]